MSVMHVKCVTEKDHLTVSEMELALVDVLLLQPTQTKSKIEQVFELLYGFISPGGVCGIRHISRVVYFQYLHTILIDMACL